MANYFLKFSVFVRSITVEPLMFMYMFSIYLGYPALQALFYRKICISHFNQSFCDILVHKGDKNVPYKAEEDLVQTETSHWILINNVALTVPSCITVLLFLGTLIDKVSHKLAMLLTLSSFIILGISNLIGSIFIHIPIGFLMIGTILNGLGGGFIAMIMSMYSYITLVTPEKSKTFRVSIVEAMLYLAAFLGVFTSGLIVDRLGFVFAFSFTTGLYVLSAFYVIIFLRDIKPDRPAVTERNCCQEVIRKIDSIWEFIKREREGQNKLFMWLMILVVLILQFATSAENDVIYLYVTRSPISWSRTLYGYFKGVESILCGVTLLALLPVLKFKLGFKDTGLILVGMLSKTVGLLLYSCTITGVIFTGAVLSMFKGFPSACLRSAASSLVDKDEHGRLFGLLGSLESIATLVATVLFNELYPASLHFFPGLCFVVTAFFVSIGGFIVGWLHVKMPGRSNHYGNLEVSDSVAIVTNEEVTESNVN